MKIIHEFTLDVSRHGVQCTVPMTQNDAGVHRLVIHLRNGSVPVALSADNGAVMFIEGDVYDPVTVYTADGAYPNCLVYDVSPRAVQTVGAVRAVLQIYKDEKQIFYAPEIMLSVREDITVGSSVLESPQYAAVVKAQAAAEEAARAAEAAGSDMRTYVDKELETFGTEHDAAFDAYKQEVAEVFAEVDEAVESMRENAENAAADVKQTQGDVQALKGQTARHSEDIEAIKQHDAQQDAAMKSKADLVDGKVPAGQLPSFVDDVVEGSLSSVTSFKDVDGNTVEPKSGKLYIDVGTGRTYRWSGSMYAEVSASLALGETSSTAYRGDRGKYAYDHSTKTGNPHATKIGDIAGLDKALDEKVGKIGGISAERRVYAVTPEGEQTAIPASVSSQSHSSVVVRDENGNYGAADPIKDGHVVNRRYLHSIASNALRGSVSGSVVAMNDVSPLEHELAVKVRRNTSDEFVDISSVEVKRYRKNILSYPYRNTTKTENGITFTDNGDGTIAANGTATNTAIFYIKYYDDDYNSGTYTISGAKGGSLGEGSYHIQVASLNNTFSAFDVTDEHTFTMDKADKLLIMIVIYKGYTANNLVFEPMLEMNTVATPYEPYIEPTTYAVEADGTVKGVTSLYPTTTLIASNSGALIECEYNRDINKAFAELTQIIISLGGNI